MKIQHWFKQKLYNIFEDQILKSVGHLIPKKVIEHKVSHYEIKQIKSRISLDLREIEYMRMPIEAVSQMAIQRAKKDLLDEVMNYAEVYYTRDDDYYPKKEVIISLWVGIPNEILNEK